MHTTLNVTAELLEKNTSWRKNDDTLQTPEILNSIINFQVPSHSNCLQNNSVAATIDNELDMNKFKWKNDVNDSCSSTSLQTASKSSPSGNLPTSYGDFAASTPCVEDCYTVAHSSNSPISSFEATKSALIKEGLKHQIKTKLNAAGVDADNIIEKSTIKEENPLKLTPQDMDRRLRRRERNKIAATKCRIKKRERTFILINESEIVHEQNSKLKNEIQRLLDEKRKLEQLLSSPIHLNSCKYIQKTVSTQNEEKKSFSGDLDDKNPSTQILENYLKQSKNDFFHHLQENDYQNNENCSSEKNMKYLNRTEQCSTVAESTSNSMHKEIDTQITHHKDKRVQLQPTETSTENFNADSSYFHLQKKRKTSKDLLKSSDESLELIHNSFLFSSNADSKKAKDYDTLLSQVFNPFLPSQDHIDTKDLSHSSPYNSELSICNNLAFETQKTNCNNVEVQDKNCNNLAIDAETINHNNMAVEIEKTDLNFNTVTKKSIQSLENFNPNEFSCVTNMSSFETNRHSECCHTEFPQSPCYSCTSFSPTSTTSPYFNPDHLSSLSNYSPIPAFSTIKNTTELFQSSKDCFLDCSTILTNFFENKNQITY